MSEFRRKLMIAYVANLGRNDIVYPGLIAAWSAKGKTNDDEDRATLKDLTGNGHDITLNGFAFSEMSGYGGYSFPQFDLDQPKENYNIVGYNKINFKKLTTTGYMISWKASQAPIIKRLRFKVEGITNQILRWGFNREPTNDIIIDKDGIYTTEEVENTLWYGIYSSNIYDNTDITITFLPEYPDALVFDGVMYKCTRDSGIPLSLMSGVIVYTPPMTIEKGKLYSEDGVIYECIQTSKVAISNKLKDLIGYYVKVFE